MALGRLGAPLMWWSWATAFTPSSLPGTPTPAERQSPNSTVSCWHRGSSTSTPITTRQVLWDPDLTPSSWHGVTSVVVGNCGFGIAPMRPANRTTIVSTLENVEGMSAEALDEGIDWCFETFAEYLDAVDRRRPRLNFAALVGHTPIRLSVLGDAASDREATPTEVERMRELVVDAMRAGAVGFATSKVAVHTGAAGKPVPSRLASLDELEGLVTALGDVGAGIIVVAGGPGLGFEEIANVATVSGRPVCTMGSPDASLEDHEAAGLWLQIACRPFVFQVTMLDPFPFGVVPAFREVLAAPRTDRRYLYEDAAWRARARLGFDQAAPTAPQLRRVSVAESSTHPELADGTTLVERAASVGLHPIDLMLDVALADGLSTRFWVVFGNDDVDALGRLLADDRVVVGISDAGAHASQICDAVFATSLLQEWVRERQVLTLEQAVRHLTSHPAEVFGLRERGIIEPGAFADLVAFDPSTVGYDRFERVHDLPAGADRLVSRSRGIEHIWINGVQTRRDSVDVDCRPGHVLRGGAVGRVRDRDGDARGTR